MSYLSDFEHTKLDAHVFPGMVVETRYISDATTGRRRVPQTRIWKVERLLGKGGFGEVRLETCEREERAVKRIWTTGTTFKVQYERELKALLEFSKPKYKESAVFVGFLGWFQDLESVYLAMEYIPLGDLEENVLMMGGKIGEREVKEIAVQILEGLKIMHLERFVHRDLKPKNVLVCRRSPDWWVKLADFGLSKRRTEETAFRTQTGTQAYMAPEILNYINGCSGYTYAVDIWALGCIIYRLIAGAVPFPPGLSLIMFCADESRFPSQPLHMSEVGVNFVRKLIAAHPSERLTSGEALQHEWTRNKSKKVDDSLGDLIVAIGDSSKNPTESSGGYNAGTRAGLQSYGNRTSAPEASVTTTNNPPKAPSIRYHQPTVEDEIKPNMNCETSAQEVRTQFLQVRDNGSPENMQVQDNLLDKDIILKPLNTKATVHNSPQTDKDFRKPKQPSEFLRGGEEEDPQNLPRTPSGRAPEIPWELPKTERQDEDAWESLSPNHSQEEERCPSSCDSDYSARLHFRTTTQRPTAERVHVSTERTVDNGREIPIRNGPPPRRTLEPTRYVVEDGKTIPVERRKSPVEQTKNNLWETVERLHLDQKLSRQRTSPIIGEGRTNRRRSGYGDGRLYRDDFGGGSFISLTEDNLRKHDYQAEPLLKWGPWDPNVCKHDYQAEPLHKWGPNDCLREVFLESHPLFTSTRAPAGQGMPQSRSPSHRGTAQPPTEQHVRPSFYADEHGFVEHAPSPPPVLEQREQFAQDKHVAGVREYMEYRPRADDTDWRSRQRDPNPFSEPPLDDLLDF